MFKLHSRDNPQAPATSRGQMIWSVQRRPWLAYALLGLGLLLLLTGTGVRIREGNLMLAGVSEGSDLLVLSGNLHVTERARLDSGLFVLCCNVLVNGEVRGDVQLLTGNLHLGPQARVLGDVGLGNGNYNQDPTAQVAGTSGGIGAGFWWALVRAFCLVPTLLLASGLLLAHRWWRRGLLERRSEPV
ncbi:polymer-forming cytoskeletal protein [Candidatus Chloroploca sp. Khr17]|uniref:polymer-forming cytoskeletal protein n=1 Tax=Candidatus Chloroploca sp. Khr17 TaxID=2496869 RepID=UPI00101C55D8|nr:polymer-forming cytoskeletal protein [Candidatus Chloroploca sp. Khr17]